SGERLADGRRGLVERPAELALATAPGDLRIAGPPVGLLTQPAAARVRAQVAGPQLFDADKRRARRDRRPQAEGLLQSDRVESAGDLGIRREDGLDFRGEPEPAAMAAEVQWAHAQPISRQRQLLPLRIPQRDRELAVEAREAAVPPLLERVDDDLRVGPGAKPVPGRGQLFTQLEVVEDLAVEGDPESAVLVAERLLSGGQIDDREPRMRQAATRVPVEAELVRPPVAQDGGHAPQHAGIGGRVGARDENAGDATHRGYPPAPPCQARGSARRSLPASSRGNESTRTNRAGTLTAGRCSRQKRWRSPSRGCLPGCSTTKAAACSPARSSFTPMTAASATSGCRATICSISTGLTRCPPIFRISFARPWWKKKPSWSHDARSPVQRQPSRRMLRVSSGSSRYPCVTLSPRATR